MKKGNWIFILTNSKSYKDVNVDQSDKINLLDNQTPLLNSDFQEAYPINNLIPGIYIVFDDWNGFLDLCKQFNDKSKIFILTHTICTLNYDSLKDKGFVNVKKGQHDPPPAGIYYPEVIRITESGRSEDEVYEGVWNAVFADHPLEEKLKVLHLCLTPDGVEKVLKDKLFERIGLERDIVNQLSLIKDPTSEAYITKLTEIRDVVLADNFK